MLSAYTFSPLLSVKGDIETFVARSKKNRTPLSTCKTFIVPTLASSETEPSNNFLKSPPHFNASQWKYHSHCCDDGCCLVAAQLELKNKWNWKGTTSRVKLLSKYYKKKAGSITHPVPFYEDIAGFLVCLFFVSNESHPLYARFLKANTFRDTLNHLGTSHTHSCIKRSVAQV